MIKVDIKKRLDSFTLNINKSIKRRDFLALFGESGAGKTTFLRILSGLETPDEGRIVVDDKIWFDSKRGINLAIQKREIGFVFQEYALFPNMSVFENLLFAKKDKIRANFLLRLIELEDLKDRYPHQLSGGQKQRVALIRALMRSPKILLLDEPLSALDPNMRRKLQDELIKIHQQFNITTILVSHEISEIFRLCKRVFVLNRGEVVKDAAPLDVFIEGKVASSFKFDALVLDIKNDGFLSVLTLEVASNIVKIVILTEEAKTQTLSL
ncbi:MAG TPA: ATP-binding cassette domain-containing protein [Campylobacterales bacterium]|nr:ATP-binding cassette domain-containing protein [Campylobacterales bacterium]